MQKNFDKKVNLLTDATIKAENIVSRKKIQTNYSVLHFLFLTHYFVEVLCTNVWPDREKTKGNKKYFKI